MGLSDIAFKQKLVSVMKDNQYERWVGGKRSGKLDSKRLYKISQSDRVFKKMQERKGKQYSVALLIDASGSMTRGGRAAMSIEAGDKLARGFEAAGVDLEIYGFNTFDWKIKGFTEKYQGLTHLEKIVSNINGNNYGASGYDLAMNDDTREMAPYDPVKHDNHRVWETTHSAQGNCDGKTIHDAVLRIKNRPGTKIIIVLSDGTPSFDYGMNWFCHDKKGKKYSDFNLKEEVNAAIRSGITFIGVGLNTTSVQSYYPEGNTVIVNDMSQLYPGIVEKLDKLIKRG